MVHENGYSAEKSATMPRMLMERNFQSIRRYALTFSPSAGNLLFVGGTGLGKTFLSACIARVVADRGFSVCYESASHLFAKLEKNRFSPDTQSRADAERFLSCDLLIIDDLGTEFPTTYTSSVFFDLLNTRLLNNKKTIITAILAVVVIIYYDYKLLAIYCSMQSHYRKYRNIYIL